MIKYISIVPVLLYILFVASKYGVQKSISESYYKITKSEKPLFFFALVITSMTFIVGYGVENQNTLNTLILFFAGAGICYSAAAARFRDGSITGTVHVFGAFGGYILGYLFIILEYKLNSLYFILPSLLIMGIVHLNEKKKEDKQHLANLSAELTDIKKYIKKNVWWDEVIGLFTIYLATIL